MHYDTKTATNDTKCMTNPPLYHLVSAALQ